MAGTQRCLCFLSLGVLKLRDQSTLTNMQILACPSPMGLGQSRGRQALGRKADRGGGGRPKAGEGERGGHRGADRGGGQHNWKALGGEGEPPQG